MYSGGAGSRRVWYCTRARYTIGTTCVAVSMLCSFVCDCVNIRVRSSCCRCRHVHFSFRKHMEKMLGTIRAFLPILLCSGWDGAGVLYLRTCERAYVGVVVVPGRGARKTSKGHDTKNTCCCESDGSSSPKCGCDQQRQETQRGARPE